MDCAKGALRETCVLMGEPDMWLVEIQARPRARHLTAVVRIRNEMALLDERDLIFYAFRDGHAA